MWKLKKVFSVAAAAALALSMMILPAQAATTPGAANCVGQATVSPGLFFPTGEERTFDWELQTTCTIVSSEGVETVNLDASGTGTGWCGRSVAAGGSGTLSNPITGQTVNLADIGWESVGSVLLVTGSHDNGGEGTFAAVVEAQGGADCASPDGATSFDVVIQATFA